MSEQKQQSDIPYAEIVDPANTTPLSPRNSYASPIVESQEPLRMVGGHYAPCPFCKNTDASPVIFTLWGGFLITRLAKCVRCLRCSGAYNGNTGKSHTLAIFAGVGSKVLLFCLLLLLAAFS